MDKQNLNLYIKKVVNYSFEANKYFNDSEPWKVKKNDLKKMQTILFTVVNQIKNISLLLSPIIPLSSNKILNVLNFDPKDMILANIKNKNCFNHNKTLGKTKILFNKIETNNDN